MVQGVSSSSGAVVGASDRGAVKSRVLVTTTKAFIDIFGEPNPKTSFMHYSALAFLADSSQLYVTRVVGDNAKHAYIELREGTDTTGADSESPITPNAPDTLSQAWDPSVNVVTDVDLGTSDEESS